MAFRATCYSPLHGVPDFDAGSIASHTHGVVHLNYAPASVAYSSRNSKPLAAPRSGDSQNLLATMPVDTSQSKYFLCDMGGYLKLGG